MAKQPAIQDPNLVPAAIFHSGTADSADTIRWTGQTTGAADVHLTSGTLGTVLGIGGTVTVTGGGGGTQFAEDAQHSSGAGGNLMLAVRTDGGTALAADGDYHVLETDGNGALRIAGTVTTGAGTQAVRIIDGTTTLVSNLNNGSINILTGTIQSSGTTTGVGVVSNLTNGSVNILTGTINSIPQVSIGTLSDLPGGTLDLGTIVGANAVGGTSTTNPIQVGGTSSTGTVYTMLIDTAGNPQVDVISIPQISVGTIPQISVGTLPTLNLTTGTITTGSLANVGQVHNAGTLAAGDNNIGNVDIATGTVTAVTTVASLTNGSINILTGTVQSSGTVTGVGVVSALTVGTIGGKAASGAAAVANPVQIAGTDSGGTVYSPLVTTGGALSIVDVPKGTVTLVSSLNNGSVNILTGTIQSAGTTTGVGVVSNLTNGSVNILTGTMTSVTNLAGGTVQINPIPVPATSVFGTLGTAGGSFFATISAASGAGTKHYISGVDIVMQSGTADVRVLAGTAIQGTGVLAAGQFPAGAGISKILTPAFATGTNSELTYHFVGAGTAFINVSYWKGA